ncbi:hypothetical protein Hamer_G008471, partial [Homarus americanus]
RNIRLSYRFCKDVGNTDLVPVSAQVWSHFGSSSVELQPLQEKVQWLQRDHIRGSGSWAIHQEVYPCQGCPQMLKVNRNRQRESDIMKEQVFQADIEKLFDIATKDAMMT